LKLPLRDRQWVSTAIARLQAATPERPERMGAIYVIRIGDRYKIGLSLNPEQRIASMQLPAKPDVVLIFRTSKAAELERTLHTKYAAHREHGEWFLLQKPQIAEIHKVCEAWRKQVEAS
jgi:hypothetical protein